MNDSWLLFTKRKWCWDYYQSIIAKTMTDWIVRSSSGHDSYTMWTFKKCLRFYKSIGSLIYIWEIFMCIYPSICYGEGQYSRVNFITHLNHPHTWNPLKYTRPIEFSPIQMDWTVGSRFKFLSFNIKSLNLWATDEGVKGMGTTPNLIFGLIQDVSSYPPQVPWSVGP